MERERIATSDPTEVYRELFPRLSRLAFLLTGSSEEAQDLTQDVFVRCAGRLHELDEPERYLRVAMVNAVRSAHRRRVVAERHSSPSPASGLADLELIEFRDALLALSERQRVAIVLRYQYGETDDEIAEALGCRRSTVRSLVRRGLQELREALS